VAQSRQHFAGLQRTIGNQAVLRMLSAGGQPQLATSSGSRPESQRGGCGGVASAPIHQRKKGCIDLNGCAWCNESTGIPETSVDHEHCAGNCVAQHEATHASDQASCCKRFGYCMINAPIGQNPCRDAWDAYMAGISDWSECNAYNIEGQCLNDILSKQCIGGGGGLDQDCCAKLQAEISTVTRKIGEHCPNAVELPCPFGEDGSLLPVP
jgi:hypothetical protein